MSISSNDNMLLLIIMSILLLSVLGHKQKSKDDDMCPSIIDVFCVKDVLLNIANASKDINNIANKIEEHILKRESLIDQDDLNKFINLQMVQIRSNLPKSSYHYQFMHVDSNINKNVLIHLIKEEHDALSYLYNSINNILMLENPFGDLTDKWFKTISNNLRKNIICNYRNIFHVYSESWLPIDQKGGIPMSKTRKRSAPSVRHKGYSIVVARLLRHWMKHISDIVSILQPSFEK